MREPFDVLVVGHATRDVERIGDAQPVERAGGVALYAGVAAARLGADTAVLTRAPAREAALVLAAAAEAGAEIIVRPGSRVTTFVNTYDADGTRHQRVTAIAPPFEPVDLRRLRARAIVLGPLTRRDMPAAVVAAARSATSLLVLAAQGIVRRIDRSGRVQIAAPARHRWLTSCDVIACDRVEAAALTGSTEPSAAAALLAERTNAEVIVTAGAAGSFVAVGKTVEHVAAVDARRIASPTGAGDTYLAAYVVARLRGDDPLRAAAFASGIAAQFLSRSGSLAGGG